MNSSANSVVALTIPGLRAETLGWILLIQSTITMNLMFIGPCIIVIFEE